MSSNPTVLQHTRDVLGRLLSEGSAVARSDGATHTLFPVAVNAAEAHALRDWVTRERARRTIEVGLGYGIAALSICEGLLVNGEAAARHVVIDPYQATRFAGCGLQFLEDAGLTALVEYHPEESQIVLPRLLSTRRSFDLAFVDGNHRFDGVFLDLVYLGRLVRRGGIVVVDDYQLPAIARAVSFCVTNLGWTLASISTADARHNWAALRTPRAPDARPYDAYVDF